MTFISALKFGNFQWSVLAITLLVAFCVGVHGQVKSRSYLGSALNALTIGVYHLTLYKVAQYVTVADVTAYLAGWTLGVMASVAFCIHLQRRTIQAPAQRIKA